MKTLDYNAIKELKFLERRYKMSEEKQNNEEIEKKVQDETKDNK